MRDEHGASVQKGFLLGVSADTWFRQQRTEDAAALNAQYHVIPAETVLRFDLSTVPVGAAEIEVILCSGVIVRVRKG